MDGTERPSPVSPTGSDLSAQDIRRDEELQWERESLGHGDLSVDQLQALLRQESSTYAPCTNYLRAREQGNTSGLVNEQWRLKLCEWSFGVIDHYAYDREVVSEAMNFVDRMAAHLTMTSDQAPSYRMYQLMVLTSLYISIKLRGHRRQSEGKEKLTIDSFVKLSHGYFRASAIEDMERNILFTLGWNLNPPTPLRFVSSFMTLMPRWTKKNRTDSFKAVNKAIFTIAMYLTELSVCCSSFTFDFSSSVVAYGALICANDILEGVLGVPPQVWEQFQANVANATGLVAESKEVREVCEVLCSLQEDHGGQDMMVEHAYNSPVHVAEELERSCRKRTRT